jgi:hypothetical protein
MTHMSRKTKDASAKVAAPKSTKPTRNVVAIYAKPGDDPVAREAETYLRPHVQAAATIREYNVGGSDDGTTGPDINALIVELTKQSSLVTRGELAWGEAMLVAQAHTLDAIFGNLARRARKAEYLENLDRYTRLALKAQAQCRTTWEAIAEMKNPRAVAFVRQANIAAGPQQVNNTSAPSGAPSRAENTENPPTKLLEAKDGERLDTRATGTPGAANPPVEAVGAVNGTEDRRG